MSKVSIDGRECQEAYGLILTAAEIGEPELETVTISVPGRTGVLDCTEKIFGGPVYKNRKIALTFKTTQKNSDIPRGELQSMLGRLWHGQTKKIVFDDDPLYFYEGRISLSFTSEGKIWTIKAECDCKPYKYLISNPGVKIL